MSNKLKAKPKKQRLPLAQTNQAAQAFGKAMQNASSQLREMEHKAYEDGFNTGEDWSNTINTVTMENGIVFESIIIQEETKANRRQIQNMQTT